MSRHHHNTKSSGGEDDFYAILGVATNSTEADIKRAYKKLALRYHPDKNPENPADAEIKFKRVTRAYEVLSCSDLRARYDRYGVAGLEGGDASSSSPSAATGGHTHQFFTSTSAHGHHPFQGFGGGHGFAFHDPFEVFRSVFGGSDPFADMMDRHHRHHHQKDASDHHHQHHDALHRHNQERHQQQKQQQQQQQQQQHQQQQQPAYGARGHPADPFRSSNNSGNTSTQREGGSMPRSRMMPPSSLFDHMMGGGFMGGGSMFNDDFFGGGGMMSGFGDMHQEMARHMKQASSMRGAAATGGSGGGGCVSTSQSVSTVIRNGRRVTRTVVRKTDANGVTTEDVDEEIEDMGGNHAPLRHHHQSSIRGGRDGGKGQHQSIQF